MFKLVVLFALAAMVSAKPGGLLGAPLAYSAVHAAPAVAVAAPAVAVPAAVSHQYRTDVISSPVIATYAAAAPVIQKTVVAAAPAVYAAPLAHAAYGHAAYGHAAYAAPVLRAW